MAIPLGVVLVGLVVLYGFGDDLNESLDGEGAIVFFVVIAPLAGLLGAFPRFGVRDYALAAAMPALLLPVAMVARFPFHVDEPWFPHPVEALIHGLTMLASAAMVGTGLLLVRAAHVPRSEGGQAD